MNYISVIIFNKLSNMLKNKMKYAIYFNLDEFYASPTL